MVATTASAGQVVRKRVHEESGEVTLTERTMHVRDNGDGTLSVVDLSTGNFVLYGEDGKAIARDHNGTPSDPFDDELLAELGMVKGSTGRNDDFCTAAVPALS